MIGFTSFVVFKDTSNLNDVTLIYLYLSYTFEYRGIPSVDVVIRNLGFLLFLDKRGHLDKEGKDCLGVRS